MEAPKNDDLGFRSMLEAILHQIVSWNMIIGFSGARKLKLLLRYQQLAHFHENHQFIEKSSVLAKQ